MSRFLKVALVAAVLSSAAGVHTPAHAQGLPPQYNTTPPPPVYGPDPCLYQEVGGGGIAIPLVHGTWIFTQCSALTDHTYELDASVPAQKAELLRLCEDLYTTGFWGQQDDTAANSPAGADKALFEAMDTYDAVADVVIPYIGGRRTPTGLRLGIAPIAGNVSPEWHYSNGATWRIPLDWSYRNRSFLSADKARVEALANAVIPHVMIYSGSTPPWLAEETAAIDGARQLLASMERNPRFGGVTVSGAQPIPPWVLSGTGVATFGLRYPADKYVLTPDVDGATSAGSTLVNTAAVVGGIPARWNPTIPIGLEILECAAWSQAPFRVWAYYVGPDCAPDPARFGSHPGRVFPTRTVYDSGDRSVGPNLTERVVRTQQVTMTNTHFGWLDADWVPRSGFYCYRDYQFTETRTTVTTTTTTTTNSAASPPTSTTSSSSHTYTSSHISGSSARGDKECDPGYFVTRRAGLGDDGTPITADDTRDTICVLQGSTHTLWLSLTIGSHPYGDTTKKLDTYDPNPTATLGRVWDPAEHGASVAADLDASEKPAGKAVRWYAQKPTTQPPLEPPAFPSYPLTLRTSPHHEWLYVGWPVYLWVDTATAACLPNELPTHACSYVSGSDPRWPTNPADQNQWNVTVSSEQAANRYRAAFPWKVVIDKGDGSAEHVCWTDWTGTMNPTWVAAYTNHYNGAVAGYQPHQSDDLLPPTSPAAADKTAPGRRPTFTTGGGAVRDGRLTLTNNELLIPEAGDCAVTYSEPGDWTMTVTAHWLLATGFDAAGAEGPGGQNVQALVGGTVVSAGRLNDRRWDVHLPGSGDKEFEDANLYPDGSRDPDHPAVTVSTLDVRVVEIHTIPNYDLT